MLTKHTVLETHKILARRVSSTRNMQKLFLPDGRNAENMHIMSKETLHAAQLKFWQQKKEVACRFDSKIVSN